MGFIKTSSSKYHPYGLKTIVGFGKHRLKTIEQIIATDPEYLDWAEDTIPNFTLTLEAKAKRNLAIIKMRADNAEEYYDPDGEEDTYDRFKKVRFKKGQ